MRTVQVQKPSFPEVAPNQPLPVPPDNVWHVVCGDDDHWRVGYYAPASTSADQLSELERHTCPELFVLQRGRLTLLLASDGKLQELPLQLGVPVLVTAPHSGYCPDGPHTGVALVVERDQFATEYRAPGEWLS
ncbi:MAG: hypothetical protein JXR83_15045 [Deltaproteobacteria bacterium]|nr:hypothetical protein [Deltaproteobacteria bacterium]